MAVAPCDGESVILVVIGESETKFVQQRRSDRVVVGNHQAAVLFVGSVIRQEIVRGGNDAGVVELGIERVLEAVAYIELLLGIEVVIEPDIEAVGIRGIRHQGLIVVGRVQDAQVGVGQGIVIQQSLSHGIDAGRGKSRSGWCCSGKARR